MMMSIRVIASSCIMISLASCCGISTHIEIGHMAATIFHDHGDAHSYRELIWKHQDAFQAGNTYPDSYYYGVCRSGKFHQVSEDTHWTAFTNVTIQYIRDTYPPPWDEEAEKLVVFLLGFVSHQVADITWHSLGIKQGFIRTMAAIDFHGVYDTAHTCADLGGDVINDFRGDYSYIQAEQWYIPVKDLAKIYKRYYGSSNTMNSEVIEECTSLIFLAVLGEKIALGEIYEWTAKQSPFLTQQLDSFFLGGMYDMALWTTHIWDNIIHILEKGFGDCSTPDNPLFIRCNSSMSEGSPAVDTHRISSREGISSLYINRKPLKHSDISKRKTKNGAVVVSKNKKIQQIKQQRKKLSKLVLNPQTVISTNKPYSRLGKLVLAADVNNDNITDLLISSPMYASENKTNYEGRVFILYGTEAGLPSGNFSVEEIANITLRGPADSAGRFGSAVAVLDINLDGYNDIVVSSPNKNWQNLTYTGGLYVWFGNKNNTFPERPSIVYNPKDAPLYDNEGLSLLTADVDLDGHPDLLVGSPLSPGPAGPQSGKVCVMISSKNFNFTTLKCIRAPGLGANTSWFGKTMIVSHSKDGSYLVVSAPYYRQCSRKDCEHSSNDTQAVGLVTIWRLPKLNMIGQIIGSTEYEHLGSSLAVGYPYKNSSEAVLAVGMDSVDVANGTIFGIHANLSQVGGVAVYNLSSLISGKDRGPSQVIYGDRQFSMFGSNIQFHDVDGDGFDDLVVAAPHYTDDPTETLYGAEQGIVMTYSSKDGQLNLNDFDDSVCQGHLFKPCPTVIASSLLSWEENKAHLGSSLAVLKYKNKINGRVSTQIVVSALRSSHGARHSGAVLIYKT